jgi:hypothetical protein
MTGGWRPWRSLLPVWLPMALFCLANLVLYAWQSSDSVGRAAQLEERLGTLETDLVRLRRLQRDAAAERARVEATTAELDHIRNEVFGDLDQRLTRIMRAVDTAVRDANFMPSSYAYSWSEEKDLALIRFQITFSITGEYAQLRRMLATLQESPEFLLVSRLSLSGEEQATSRELRIGVTLTTFLSTADRERLQLIGAERGGADAAAPKPAAASAEPKGGNVGLE